MPLSSARNFQRHGFAVLSGFLDGFETAKARALVESALASAHEPACARPNNTLVALRWNDPIVELFLASDRRLQVLGDAIDADDLKWISGYLSLKEPRSLALAWHQDWWCWDHPLSYGRKAPQVAVLCYLADTGVHNGALRVLPGSHVGSMPVHAVLIKAPDATRDREAESITMADLPRQVTPELKAGDAAVIDYRLVHGTHGNPSTNRRDCILLSFVPSWRRLPDEIKAHLIQHPAQPSENELPRMSVTTSRMIPTFSGVRRSLALNRNAPARFAALGFNANSPAR